MKFTSLKGICLKNARALIGGCISIMDFHQTMLFRNTLNAWNLPQMNLQPKLYELDCTHCRHTMMVAPEDMHAYQMGKHYWLEAKCINTKGCGLWFQQRLNLEGWLELRLHNVPKHIVFWPEERKYETGEITEGYISDFVYDLWEFDTPIKIMEHEGTLT